MLWSFCTCYRFFDVIDSSGTGFLDAFSRVEEELCALALDATRQTVDDVTSVIQSRLLACSGFLFFSGIFCCVFYLLLR